MRKGSRGAMIVDGCCREACEEDKAIVGRHAILENVAMKYDIMKLWCYQ